MIKWLDLPQDNQVAISDKQALVIGEFLMQGNDAVALVSVLKAFDQFNVKEEQLTQNKIPTLIIIGTQDNSIIAARQHIEHFKNARLKEILGKEHAGILGSKEYYNAVEEFINQ
jgi:pimeloyl-ACP methyl ester carboxylesterase